MALEDIFRALEEQADRDIAAVTAEAKEHAEAILEEASREAELLRETQVAEAERHSRAKGLQSLNTARLEARKRVAAVKEGAVAAAFAEARESLKSVRGRQDYPGLFESLLVEALAGVGSGAEVLVDPADVRLAEETLAKLGVAAEVRPEIVSAGGVVVQTDGGRVLRRNTLEDRLDKFEAGAQADVAEILFA